MRVVHAVLVVIDYRLGAHLFDNVGMEKSDVPGSWRLFHCDCGSVDLVDPETRDVRLLLVVFDLIVHIWP